MLAASTRACGLAAHAGVSQASGERASGLAVCGLTVVPSRGGEVTEINDLSKAKPYGNAMEAAGAAMKGAF
jgi:hypothetical protein